MIEAGRDRLDEIKRFDMPGFRPRKEFLREMKRYGILPPTFDLDNDPADPYEIDRRYWDSFIYTPL
jgi:inorganic pyrophosphatase